jgi:predicted ATPase
LQRAGATVEGFEITDANASDVGEICWLLDGIPLAIELAAGRFDALGVGGLLGLLRDRQPLGLSGARQAIPRHRTLEATIAWSYELLPEAERAAFRRAAIFAGDFTLEAARAVFTASGLDAAVSVELVSALVSKSLLAADIGGAVPHYRMLETTRAYARERLDEAQETAELARFHAEYFASFFDRLGAEWGVGLR